MKTYQTETKEWILEYDNGQRVLPGDIMRDNNDNAVKFLGVAGEYVEFAEASHRVSVNDFPNKFEAEHERMAAKEPPKTSQGPSVVDRGSKEIELRWAKETIGMVAVELNEAYAQFDISRNGCEIPLGKLHCAAKRLEEAMQRLGHTGGEIPF